MCGIQGCVALQQTTSCSKQIPKSNPFISPFFHPTIHGFYSQIQLLTHPPTYPMSHSSVLLFSHSVISFNIYVQWDGQILILHFPRWQEGQGKKRIENERIETRFNRLDQPGLKKFFKIREVVKEFFSGFSKSRVVGFSLIQLKPFAFV